LRMIMYILCRMLHRCCMCARGYAGDTHYRFKCGRYPSLKPINLCQFGPCRVGTPIVVKKANNTHGVTASVYGVEPSISNDPDCTR